MRREEGKEWSKHTVRSFFLLSDLMTTTHSDIRAEDEEIFFFNFIFSHSPDFPFLLPLSAFPANRFRIK